MLRTILFKFLMYVYFLLWSPVLLVGLVSKKLNRAIISAEVTGLLILVRIVMGIKYRVNYPQCEESGIPLKPNNNARNDGKAIIAAKHMSILEIAILYRTIPKSFFIVKRELMWIPIYGWAFWRLGLVPVNRTRGKTNMKKLADTVANKILAGGVLVIFPEGTRVKPGARPALRRGLLFLAHELKLPILPVGTDSGLYWPKRGKMRSGTANIYFEELLPCTASLDEIAESINQHSA